MKQKVMLILAISLSLLALPKSNFCQTNGTLNLGILSTFEAYTGAGGIANGAGANVSGDVGTQVGKISGFGAPLVYTGNTYNANAVTVQCRVDLFRLYIHLNDLFVTYPATHTPVFGNNETLPPGVYSIPMAGSIDGTLTLDGGGNPNAYFVIKYYGAMTVGASSRVNLTGGTKSCNVFWIAEGAISVAANATIKGTLFAKIGAVGLGESVVLEGRMLTLEGAITTGANAIAGPPLGICTIPIFCETICSPAAVVDVLGVLSNFALYTSLGAVANTSTSGIDGNLGTSNGAISGYETSIIAGSFNNANTLADQAKIDIDVAYTKLMALPNTATHAAVFGAVGVGLGAGETVTAGVYDIPGAGSLLGTLKLDANGVSDAIFVFRFSGALTVAAASKIILTNGARRCNVFFIGGAGVATGAISIEAGAVLKGTFLSHGGACGSGAGTFLAGRQLSTGGEVSTYSGIIFNNPVCVTSRSLGMPVILAIADTTAAVNGGTGGTTAALTLNDVLGEVSVVIGTAPGDVVLTGVTVPLGMTLNANGTVSVAPNTPAGNYSLTYKICEVTNITNCSSVTSRIVVSTPVILAVADITAAVDGLLGGITSPLTLNDELGGVTVVIGTAPGNVTLSEVTVPTGMTLNANGTVNIAPNLPVGTYSLTYKICEVNNPTNCSSVTSIILVSAPLILAVTDITVGVNGLSGGTTPSLTLNDILNGTPVVIGTAPGNVILSGTFVPTGLTLNANGTVTVAPNTATGTYGLTYRICEVNNSTNCSLVTSNIVVSPPAAVADLSPKTSLSPNIMQGTTQFEVTIKVMELLGNPTNGSEIIVRVPKDPRILITYNPAATQIDFTSVNNSIWTYDGSNASFHIFKTSAVIAATTFSTFGFEATFTPGQSSGRFTLTASLNPGSGGEQNVQNNQNSVIVDYFIN